MTNTRFRYYEAIRSYIAKNGHSPTYQEIGAMVGVRSSATVHNAVKKLIAEGALAKDTSSLYANLIVIPSHIQKLDSCNRGHPNIWFLTTTCPLCDVLQRMQKVS